MMGMFLMKISLIVFCMLGVLGYNAQASSQKDMTSPPLSLKKDDWVLKKEEVKIPLRKIRQTNGTVTKYTLEPLPPHPKTQPPHHKTHSKVHA